MIAPSVFPAIDEQQSVYNELQQAVNHAVAIYDAAVSFPRPRDVEGRITADWVRQRAIFEYLSDQLLARYRQHSFDVSTHGQRRVD